MTAIVALQFMNTLFDTVPLSFTQGLICIGAGFPVIIIGAFLRHFDPLK